jgi:hypothetical protein
MECPTQNTDGSPLTNLAGYRIYYGTDAAALAYSATIDTTDATSYVVSGLDSGTWYFVTAFTSRHSKATCQSGDKTI